MAKSMIVLSVPHQLQGPNFPQFVDDPTYREVIEHKIENGVDFVFEEASGLGPTTAENIAASVLGPGHYLNVDPTPAERVQLSIGTAGGTTGIGDVGEAIMSGFSPDALEWTVVSEQRKREEIWLKRIRAQAFETGLLICGAAHNLSLAFRLMSVEINVVKTYSYIPYHKVCNRPHDKGKR
jgi:hypothetical protein